MSILRDLALLPVLGRPLFTIIGMLAFLSFAVTAYIGMRNMKGDNRISIRWHFRLAKVALGLMVLHVVLASSLLFK
ncbi:hypothetical protein EPO05_01280 [Patescibacteria group bacterium]|nr:MAG: hypothetical protein EPO05_01280 [Patescibacteria group bacterium]